MTQKLLQLDPSIPLVTPDGPGDCFLVIDYSQEHNILWVVADRATGRIGCWDNSLVRFEKNYSLLRPNPEIPKPRQMPGVLEKDPRK